ncbi:MAG: hypothetical protein DRM99_00810 [Thermoplasmata archaeon]|nr:MAG: hypothetical protein DRM99_00810 [Thermoplasmata archaeon]
MKKIRYNKVEVINEYDDIDNDLATTLTIYKNKSKRKYTGGITLIHKTFILSFLLKTKKDVEILINDLKKLIE